DNRVLTLAADLSESINLEHGSIWGHYDPETNPLGTRLKAAIEEAGNVSSAIGLVGQSASLDPNQFAGVWAFSGTYGAFTPLMYLPARVWSQQNQDSKFRTGVLHILAGHSGPETAADARTHFGIFAPQVWKLFPRDQVINLSFWTTTTWPPATSPPPRSPRAKRRSASSSSRWHAPTSAWPTATRSPTPICGPPPRVSTSSATSRPASPDTATSWPRDRARRSIS